MRIDTLAHVKNQISAVIDQLGSEPLFITRNGKVAAVLQAVSDDEVEDYLFRNSPRFWRLIEARRTQAAKALSFDPSHYGSDDLTVKTALVREKTTEYTTKRKRKA
jgi:PHD/YefM family antitoxin component YafN of YafNO toxin-antitoxin module